MMWSPAVLCALCVVAMIAAEGSGNWAARAAAKAIASVAFVGQAVAAGAFAAGHPGQTVIAALILSVVGDLCLLSADKKVFLAGIGAFLLAHVLYIATFAQLGVDPVGAIAGIAGLGLVTGSLARRFVPASGALAPAVAAYVGVITVMGGMAVGCAVAAPSVPRVVLSVAAIAFMASDVCVARERFERAGLVNRAVGWVLYYGAQLLFAGVIASVPR